MKKRNLLNATCLIALALISGSYVSTADGYKVSAVIDGDTIELSDGGRLRYLGIDTPEIRTREEDEWVYAPEPYALEALDYNSGSVLGKTVILEFDEQKEDKYGRILAYVYTYDGCMMNLELLRAGLATVYTFPPNIKYLKEFISAQNEARENARGIWSSVSEILPEDATGHDGEVCIAKGEITDVDTVRGTVFLYFGVRGKISWTAVIPSRNTVLFREEGIDPEIHYRGRQVEVTGKVSSRRGPRIYLDNPSMIRII